MIREDPLHLTRSSVTSVLLGSFDNEQQGETTERAGCIWYSGILMAMLPAERARTAEPAPIFEWSPALPLDES
jgi:hypothetical protein